MLYGVTANEQIQHPRCTRASSHPLTSLRVCKSHRDTLRHADLVELEVRVSCDDRPRAEVDTLAHQVTAQPPFLALKPSSDRLDRAPALLQRLRDACNVVVHVGRDVELQQLLEVGDDVRGCAFLLRPPHVRARLEDVAQLIRQVVLGAHRTAVD